MASQSRDLRIRYVGDTSGVKKSLGELDSMHAKVGAKLKSVGAGMTNVGRTATLGLTLPLVGFGKMAIDEFGEAQRGIEQTAAVLKSTGGAANVTEGDVSRLADRLGKLAQVDNDVVREGQNMLLTFTNIRNEAGKGNDIFNQTTRVLADLSAATGKDMKSSAIGLGKALNNPIAGISALSRVGVAFTDQQKKQITALQESGDIMGAQKIILAELNTEFGGSAAAMGRAATPTQKIALAFKDLAEQAGAVLAPMLEQLVKWVQQAADWFNNLSPSAKEMAVKIALVAAAVGPLLIIFGKLTSAVGSIISVGSKLGMLANPWVLIGLAVAALVVLVIRNWDKIKGYVLPVLETIKDVALAVWDAIAKAATVVWNAVSGAVKIAWSVIKPIATAYLTVWRGIFRVVWEVAKVVWVAIREVVKVAWTVIRGIAKAYLTVWRGIFTVVKVVALAVWNAIREAVSRAWDIIRGIATTLKAFWVGVWNAIKSVASTVWQAIAGFFGNLWDRLRGIGTSVREFWSGVWTSVKEKATGIWDAIVGAFRGAINSIIGLWNRLDFRIDFTLPDVKYVPGLDGQHISTPDLIPDLPYLAKGGRIMAAGLAVVGERGPELVGLSAGATVAPLGSGGGGPMRVELNLDRRRYGRALELTYLSGRRG